MAVVIYIHGFGSNGFGSKAQKLRQDFAQKRISILSPSLSHIPELAIDTLEQVIEVITQNEEVVLIGSSLGGFYATYLAEKYNLKAVLINPAVNADERLDAMTPKAQSFYDGSFYDWTPKHVASLKAFNVPVTRQGNFLVYLQTGDEVLDYRLAEQKFAGSTLMIEDGGNHSFEGFDNKVSEVLAFFKIND